MRITLIILILLGVGLGPAMVLARIGVGVNLGKIEIDEPLKPGGIYNFPSISVVNTGDESGTYEIEVTYHEGQEELKPLQDWFRFDPHTFALAAGESRLVTVILTLPVKTDPGEYFAYIEAHPIAKQATAEGARIGVAAATKTYFSVRSANLWQAVSSRITTFIENTKPASYIAGVLILLAFLILLFKRFFALNIGFSRKK